MIDAQCDSNRISDTSWSLASDEEKAKATSTINPVSMLSSPSRQKISGRQISSEHELPKQDLKGIVSRWDQTATDIELGEVSQSKLLSLRVPEVLNASVLSHEPALPSRVSLKAKEKQSYLSKEEVPPPTNKKQTSWINRITSFLSWGPSKDEVPAAEEIMAKLPKPASESIKKTRLLSMRNLMFAQLFDFIIYCVVHCYCSGSGLWSPSFKSLTKKDTHYIDLIFALMALGLLVCAIMQRNLKMTKIVMAILFFRNVLAQTLLFMTHQYYKPFSLAILYFQNFVRATVSLLISQYLISKTLKLCFVLTYFAFTVMSLVFVIIGFDSDIMKVLDTRMAIISVVASLAFTCYIIFKIFDSAFQSSLASSLYAFQSQQQMSSIFQSINTGIVTRENLPYEDSRLQFVNRFAMRLLGGEGFWEEYKNQVGDVVSAENALSKDEVDELMNAPKFFKSSEGGSESSTESGHSYSIKDLFALAEEELAHAVFNEGDTYIRVHKSTYRDTEVNFESLEIQDVSHEFLANQGEKNLLSLINATVSHEMRTPINSINSQNIEAGCLIGRIVEEVSQDEANKEKLLSLVDKMKVCHSISRSSTKFLTFEINDMLDFSQLKQGKFRKMPQAFDVRESIQEIIAVQDYKAKQLGIKIKVNFFGFGSDFKIRTDEQRLQQVLMNLISNALKFTLSGGYINIFCHLEKARSQFGNIQITVSDTGIGIKQEDQAKLFQLFGYIDSTKELNTRGIGLGLHICQMITKSFGGSIACESEFGKGASFTFDFCLEDPQLSLESFSQRCLNPQQPAYPKFQLEKGNHCPQEDIVQRGSTTSASPHSHTPGSVNYLALPKSPQESPDSWRLTNRTKSNSMFSVRPMTTPIQATPLFSSVNCSSRFEDAKRILAVDDEPFNITALQILLKESGVSDIMKAVDFAKNGQEAVDLVTQNLKVNGTVYGLVLMDCSMPVKDGFETTDEIRELYRDQNVPQPKIVACTGHCERQYIEKAWRHSMDEFVSKPLKLATISQILKEIIIPS